MSEPRETKKGDTVTVDVNTGEILKIEPREDKEHEIEDYYFGKEADMK